MESEHDNIVRWRKVEYKLYNAGNNGVVGLEVIVLWSMDVE